jgi:hypothetical protein
MSKRNSREAKARRRAERAARKEVVPVDGHGLVDVKTMPELVAMAERRETMACGCDAHGLLHEMLGISGGS